MRAGAVIGEADDEEGVKIVLTASRADMSDFEDDAFTAFLCTFPRFLVLLQDDYPTFSA